MRKATWLLAALALTGGLGSEWIRPSTHARCLPGIPDRDYQGLGQLPQTSALKVGTSFKGVELTDVNAGPATARSIKVRTYAMDQKDLKIDHCSIAQVAFTIGSDGRWIFNCRADQNPWFTTQPSGMPAPKNGVGLKIETNHLLRNEFCVTVRCYGNFPLKEADKTTGKPALFAAPPILFMVQRGVPFVVNASGAAPDVQQFYPLIDRVEFEFYYR